MTLACGHAFLKACAMPNRRRPSSEADAIRLANVFNVLSMLLRTANIATAVRTRAKAIQSAWRPNSSDRSNAWIAILRHRESCYCPRHDCFRRAHVAQSFLVRLDSYPFYLAAMLVARFRGDRTVASWLGPVRRLHPSLRQGLGKKLREV